MVTATIGRMSTIKLTSQRGAPALGRRMLNKVPEVTVFFWIIKILATTVGETASDYFNETLGFGLHNTTYVMGAVLIAVLVGQFRLNRYVPWVYWLTVVLISIVGTLITDNLTDGWNVPLTTSTPIFAGLLALTFAAWYASERTLSIHSIFTRRREAFYWLTILFTFALGTAAGDLLQEQAGWSLAALAALWAGAIALITAAHYAVQATLDAEHRHRASSAVLAFWLAYIMTRPLGASLGDLLTLPRDESPAGLGLGTNRVSIIFAVIIVGLVAYLTKTKRDVIEVVDGDEQTAAPARGQHEHAHHAGRWQPQPEPAADPGSAQ